jgi:hypothetical protein
MVKLNNTVPVPPHNTGITGGMAGVKNNEVPAPAHNTGITGGMKFENLENATPEKLTSSPKRIFAPTPGQLKASYQAIADNAFENHTAKKLKSAPKGAGKAEGIDITEPGVRGAKREVFAVGNKLYVKLTPVALDPKPSWYLVGFQPMFMSR